MIKKTFFIFLNITILLFYSCDADIPSDTVDKEFNQYSLIKLIAPDSLLFDPIDSSFVTSIELNDGAEISNMWVNFSTTDGKVDIGLSIPMFDDGNMDGAGDTIASDNVYSGKLIISRFSPFGDYNLEFYIKTPDEIVRKVGVHKLFYDNAQHNAIPVIQSIIAPAEITIGASPVGFIIAAAVTDSNGLQDINSVWFTNTRPDGSSSGTQFFLNDNGNTGDATAGDGLFSSGFELPTSTTKGNWKFNFQAKDRRDSLSQIIVHSIVVK